MVRGVRGRVGEGEGDAHGLGRQAERRHNAVVVVVDPTGHGAHENLTVAAGEPRRHRCVPTEGRERAEQMPPVGRRPQCVLVDLEHPVIRGIGRRQQHGPSPERDRPCPHPRDAAVCRPEQRRALLGRAPSGGDTAGVDLVVVAVVGRRCERHEARPFGRVATLAGDPEAGVTRRRCDAQWRRQPRGLAAGARARERGCGARPGRRCRRRGSCRRSVLIR